jgi:hypothetical protein
MLYLQIFEIGTYFINDLTDWLVYILFKVSLWYKVIQKPNRIIKNQKFLCF